MTNKTETVYLSAMEAEYLSKLTSEDDSFSALLRSHPDLSLNGREVTLSRIMAELLRDYFTQRLARVGFDADYKPNKEGQLLEQLIDTFFMPDAPRSGV
jgi:hypothetical protein